MEAEEVSLRGHGGYLYIYIYIYISIYIYLCIYIYICMYICMYVCMYVPYITEIYSDLDKYTNIMYMLTKPIKIPLVLHKAVAEVSKIGNL